MLQAHRWTGRVTVSDGTNIDLATESVEVRRETVTVIFSGATRRPMHVSVRWNGGSILSVTNMTSDSEKLLDNPGRVVWKEESGELYFLANVDELSEVCASQCHGSKIADNA